MSHNHSHEAPKNLTRLVLAILINIAIVIFEIILGILSNSLALISDAFHNITDISSMILGYISEKLSQKSPSKTKTFGYKKIEFVSAFINSFVLLLVTIYILYEGILRLLHPEQVISLQMLYVGIVAVIGNGVATWILSHGSKDNTNMKAVWLHSLQDALLSVGVIIGAGIIYFTGWNIIDPLLSIFISIFLLKSIYLLLKETFNALVDSVPDNIDFDKVRQDLLAIDGIKTVSDLHIWLSDSHTPMLSVHITTQTIDKNGNIFIKAKKLLHDTYDIEHTTLQIIPAKIASTDFHCEHCN